VGAYQQMGHQSHNLLLDEGLASYVGMVASPVNYTHAELVEHVLPARFRRGLDVVFDPQLYVPSSERGQLRQWSYFPSDVESADLASDEWWQALNANICDCAAELKADAVCSPVVIPRAFSDDYFSRAIATGADLRKRAEASSMRPLQTIVVGLKDLVVYSRVMEIASIVTRSACEEIYLVLVGDTPPRRELNEPEEIKGAMRLINSLQTTGLNVFVAFSSSDMVLWKAAGALNVGTGKFFNLRRFTRARFEEPKDAGGALPYWFEESLVAFLRASDLQRVQRVGLFSEASLTNPFGIEILDALPRNKAWIGLGWRQYLRWFADMEQRISSGIVNVDGLLVKTEENWKSLGKATPPVLMEEPSNDGSWIRPWRRALLEYPYAE
jgi:hypothetical protein